MLGRAAQGRPWIFREIGYFLETGRQLAAPSREKIKTIMLEHLENLYLLYGEYMGIRVARKHVGWYCKDQAHEASFRNEFNRMEKTCQQLAAIREFFV